MIVHMTTTEETNLALVLRYLRAIEAGVTGEAMREFLDEGVVQVEYPNRLSPAGARRDRAAIEAASERGAKAVRGQRYEVRGSVVQGDRVVLEIDWSATVAATAGGLREGQEMRASFAWVVEVRGGRVVAMRNYDCFAPW